jgi:endo-1,4-beta-xylanase
LRFWPVMLCLPTSFVFSSEAPSHAEFLSQHGLGEAKPVVGAGGDLELVFPRNQTDLGERQVLALDRGPAATAVRLTVHRRDDWPPAVQLLARVPVELPEGEALVLLFWARGGIVGQGGSEGQLEVVLRDTTRTGVMSDLTRHKLRLNDGWQRCVVPVALTRGGIPAGKLEISLHAAFREQYVDIAAFEVYACGQRHLKELPTSTRQLTYAGREADAPWRAAAAERIAQVRQAPLAVRVVDERGAPVADAQVRVRQEASAFRFGTMIQAGGAFHPDAPGHDPRDRALALEHFNSYTVNEFYWQSWDKKRPDRMRRASAVLDELQAWRRPVRAHVLVWPSWRYVPEALREDLKGDPAALRQAIELHIRACVGFCKGRVDIYDVVNEPHTNHELTDLLGEESLAQWFRRTHALDPNARLCLNEFDILGRWHDPVGRRAKQDAHYALVRRLLDAGAPLRLLGFQGHFKDPTPIPEILATLDRFGELGLGLEITEFDQTLGDEALEADYLRDLLTACFSHPSVEGFAMWGIADHRHWLGYAPLYRRDWSEKPAAKVWRELQAAWRTNVTGLTDSDGAYRVRAYQGRLAVTVSTPDGRSGYAEINLNQQGATATIQIKP